MAERKFWLMKSEPYVYGLDDLERDGSTLWDGVRNYQARNFMRDEMNQGDLILYYHSNAKPPGVVGLATVSSEPYPDPTQFDESSKYYDAKSTTDDPRWILIDIAFEARFPRMVSLQDLKEDDDLDGMLVTKKGQRLSIQPVERRHMERVIELAGSDYEV
ncbi:MAG: EVE domain-containing protein [Acidobacteriota bacterium]